MLTLESSSPFSRALVSSVLTLWPSVLPVASSLRDLRRQSVPVGFEINRELDQSRTGSSEVDEYMLPDVMKKFVSVASRTLSPTAFSIILPSLVGASVFVCLL